MPKNQDHDDRHQHHHQQQQHHHHHQQQQQQQQHHDIRHRSGEDPVLDYKQGTHYRYPLKATYDHHHIDTVSHGHGEHDVHYHSAMQSTQKSRHQIGDEVDIVKDVRRFVKLYGQKTGAPLSIKSNYKIPKKATVSGNNSRRDSFDSINIKSSHGTSFGPFEPPPALLTMTEAEEHRFHGSHSPRDEAHQETEVKVRAHMLVITDKTPVRERLAAFERGHDQHHTTTTRNFVVGRPRKLSDTLAAPIASSYASGHRIKG